MKFKFWSDKDLVSLIHVPGRGLGTYRNDRDKIHDIFDKRSFCWTRLTLWGSTRSQLADMERCSLNLPAKASLMSRSLKAQTAEPPMELTGVVKVA